MSRRAQKVKTEFRQEQIAVAALKLIAVRGLDELNIGALARQVGVVPSAIYRHYKGKDEVLVSVLDLISRSLLANIEAVCQETPDALDRLHLLLMRHVQLVRHHVGIPRVLFSEQIFARSGGRRRRAHQTLNGYLQKIATIIREGQRQGQIRGDVSSDTAGIMFLGLVQPALILWLMSNKTFDVVRHAEEAWRVFREMLQATENQLGSKMDREPESEDRALHPKGKNNLKTTNLNGQQRCDLQTDKSKLKSKP